ncbi:hypothetical protein MMC06_000932 [Schaereria dolodes]|nr:hypothetical protein [Schaereria dolodes]
MSESERPPSSDVDEQTPRQPSKSRPTQQISDSETDPGYRSRSQSRRRRRKQQNARHPKDNPMPALEENQAAEAHAQNTMRPLQRIGPDETSMDGPVTYARAQRGEIPMREGNPNQKMKTAGGQESSKMMDQDGLKLRLELNLDIEIELKASIKGDITLALL